ncbi:MAG: hypothetical protein NZL91_07115 [Thermoflexales bacterium]|nr:hypothetical protein [Thermoflexales bacterium]
MIYNLETLTVKHLLTWWLFYAHAIGSFLPFSLSTLRAKMHFFEMTCGRAGCKPCGTIFGGETLSAPLHTMRRVLDDGRWLTLLHTVHHLGPLLLGDLPQMHRTDLEDLRARLSCPLSYAQAVLTLCETDSAYDKQVLGDALRDIPISQWAHCFAPFVSLRRCLPRWVGQMHAEAWCSLDKETQRWLAALWWLHYSYVHNDASRPTPIIAHMLANDPVGDWLSHLGMTVVSATPQNKTARLQDENVPEHPHVCKFVEELLASAIVVQAIARYSMHPDHRGVVLLKKTWAKEILGLECAQPCTVSPRDVWRLNALGVDSPLHHALQVSPWLAAAWLRWLAEAENDVLMIAQSAQLVDQIWGLNYIYLEPETYAQLAQKLATASERAEDLQLAHRLQALARHADATEALMWRLYIDIEVNVGELVARYGEDVDRLACAARDYQQTIEDHPPVWQSIV